MIRVLPVALLAFFFCCPYSKATVQAKDSLIYEQEKGFINESPLSDVLTKRSLKLEATSTANYSGYRARWKIADSKLYLTEFNGRKNGEDNNLKWLFPDSDGSVFANWYSGKIHLFLGKAKLRKIYGHVVVTERLVVFQVEKGLIKSTHTEKYPDNIETINKMVSEFLGKKTDMREIGY